jgi:hypothetical protein
MSAPGIGDPHSPRRGFFPAPPASAITAETRSLAAIDADQTTALREEISWQEAIARKRRARIRIERARRKAKFIMLPPAVSAAARIGKARLMARRG